jgi:hypothetical protein
VPENAPRAGSESRQFILVRDACRARRGAASSECIRLRAAADARDLVPMAAVGARFRSDAVPVRQAGLENPKRDLRTVPE